MTLAELIARFRTDANDKAEPYFWSDSEVTAWLNDAVSEAAVRGRLIHESADADMCSISVVEGTTSYPLHSLMYELDGVWFQKAGESEQRKIRLVSTEYLDASLRDWKRASGTPEYAVQTDNAIRLVPSPDAVGTLTLEGYRLPAAPMIDDEDTPEINGAHHVHLIQWALHRGFSVPDTEAFDPRRADIAEAEFTRYFGLRPDADMRRTTRHDVPHHVEAFWP